MNKKFGIVGVIFLTIMILSLLGGNWESALAQGTVPIVPPSVTPDLTWTNLIEETPLPIGTTELNECCCCDEEELIGKIIPVNFIDILFITTLMLCISGIVVTLLTKFL